MYLTLPATHLRNGVDNTDWWDMEESGERAAQSAGGSRGTGISRKQGLRAGESILPILWPLPYKHVTFLFVQRSWEELDTSLSTLPITIALLPVLDDEMITVIKLVLPCYVKLSNFIMLTDELSLRANTPTEISSFVKQSKLIHYMSKNFVTTG